MATLSIQIRSLPFFPFQAIYLLATNSDLQGRIFLHPHLSIPIQLAIKFIRSCDNPSQTHCTPARTSSKMPRTKTAPYEIRGLNKAPEVDRSEVGYLQSVAEGTPEKRKELHAALLHENVIHLPNQIKPVSNLILFPLSAVLSLQIVACNFESKERRTDVV